MDEQHKVCTEQAKVARTSKKRTFTRKYKLFFEALDQEHPQTAIDKAFEQLCTAYNEVESQHERYVQLLAECNIEESKLQEEDDYILELERNKNNAQAAYSKSMIKSELDNSKLKIKVKAIDPPKFNGDVRAYPNFKADFGRLMKTNFGCDPFVLKQCLEGEALCTVKGVEHDFEEMFERLDYKFGDKRKVVDTVINELKTIKVIYDGDYKGFINMVNKVEQAYLDLKSMNLESEMNCTNIVSLVERILPDMQKREWVKVTDGLQSSDELFPKLLEYLLREKRVLEYLNSSVRTTVTKASVHNTSMVESERKEGESNVAQVLQCIQNGQAKMEECIMNLTKVIANMNNGTEVKQGFRNSLNKCWIHNAWNHDIANCKVFLNYNTQEKMDILRKRGICFQCLKGYHLASNCTMKNGCNIEENGKKCGRAHHPLLHPAHSDGTLFHNACNSNRSLKEKSLLMMSRIYCKGIYINTLWDSGSDISMITHRMARKLNLKGKDITLSITKVGNRSETLHTKEYVVPVIDLEGNEWNITAFGIEEITSNVSKVDISNVACLFDGISISDIVRPIGAVDLLIGTDWCNLLPEVQQTIGKLQLMKNKFGFCLRGSHPLLKFDGNWSDIHCLRVHHSTGFMNVNEISHKDFRQIQAKNSIEEFFEIESLGTFCNPKCGSCKCGNCAIGNNNYSLREERELALIDKGLTYSENERHWIAQYPWIKHPDNLPNNVSAAIVRLQSTERRLQRLGPEYANMYKDEMSNMVARNVARKLTREEIDKFSGPVHYVYHHEVLKVGSISTPMRIVFNTSASFMGHKLNDYWAKGPDVLNNLLAVLLRFREKDVAIVGDISKMYNSIKLGSLEQNTHRYVWRDMDLNKDPEHYVLTAVSFGDRPSGIIAIRALQRTVEMHKEEFPEVCKVIQRNSYVDDLLCSVNSVSEAKMLIKNTEKVLSYGNFKIKHWIVSGIEECNEEVNLFPTKEEKILGMAWNTKEDKFSFNIKFDILKGLKKNETTVMEVFTKRKVYSQASSIYDPLGFITPFTLRAKLLMRELAVKGNGSGSKEWDKPLTEEDTVKWEKFFADMLHLGTLIFDRCLGNSDSYKNPMLIVFSDGSSIAYGTCAYIRWELPSGAVQCKLIASKSRIAPSKHQTIPRLELCGAVLACRLREFIQKELEIEFQDVIHIVDSSIIRAQIQKESYGFGVFVANRIAEIQAKTNPKEWWWVSSDNNPADMTTRPTHPSNLGTNSVWQRGPSFLYEPRDRWPIYQDCEEDLPDRIGLINNIKSITSQERISIINIDRFSSYNKLLRVTSRILTAYDMKSFKGILEPVNVGRLKEAENWWIKQVQQELPADWYRIYKRLGPKMDSKGLIVVGSRIEKWLKLNWNQNSFVLLSANHKFTELYIKHLHEIDHAGIETTLAKLQTKYWVPGARKIIAQLKEKCIKCRMFNPKPSGQSMGQMESNRLTPSPPFFNTAVDLFGPFSIRDNVKRRTIGKSYGVVFNCLSTRAVYIDLADSYNTQSFLSVFKRFVSIRGYPNKIHSDLGTQLVAASKELKKVFSIESDIVNNSMNNGTTWVFNQAADAPWQNGCSESLIKLIKRGICMMIGETVMTYGELQTVFFEIANLLNERPIGMKPGSNINLGTYLCPNDLLLGRTSAKAPNGNWEKISSAQSRLAFMEKVIDGFWKKWQRDYFHTLIIRQKWHVEKRNLQPGDIVLVQDCNLIRGKWRLAQVLSVEPGRDSKVRNAVIRYKISKPGIQYKGQDDVEVKRSVHKLCVLLPVEEQ